MLTKLKKWILSWFEDPVEPVPQYNIPEHWPFEGEKPTNDLVHKLMSSLECLDGHVLYRRGDSRKISSTVNWDGHGYLVKELVWWLNGGVLEDKRYDTVRATCGWSRCCNPTHIEAKYIIQSKPKDPEPLTLPIKKVKGPPQYRSKKRKRVYSQKRDSTMQQESRTKCVSAKLWYPTEASAAVAVRETEAKRGTNGRRQYKYKCTWCSGWHLTSQNPKNRKNRKPVGTWT